MRRLRSRSGAHAVGGSGRKGRTPVAPPGDKGERESFRVEGDEAAVTYGERVRDVAVVWSIDLREPESAS
jgi:hypothetical protein